LPASRSAGAWPSSRQLHLLWPSASRWSPASPPFTDLANIVRLAATACTATGSACDPRSTSLPPSRNRPSLVDTLPRNPANEILASELRAVDPNSGTLFFRSGRPAPRRRRRALHALLANAGPPSASDEALRGLPGDAAARIRRIALALRVASRLVAPGSRFANRANTTTLFSQSAESVALAGQ
jgi:hypothetical protein